MLTSWDACIISMERVLLLLFEISVIASAHTAHAFRVLLCFFGLHWISRHFLPRSFEEAAPCVCAFLLDPPHITSCLLCEQRKLCDVRNHALIIFYIRLRSRWGDLRWCAQRELWFQHRYVKCFHYSNIYIFSISLSLSLLLTFASVVFILCVWFFLNLDYSFWLFLKILCWFWVFSFAIQENSLSVNITFCYALIWLKMVSFVAECFFIGTPSKSRNNHILAKNGSI